MDYKLKCLHILLVIKNYKDGFYNLVVYTSKNKEILRRKLVGQLTSNALRGRVTIIGYEFVHVNYVNITKDTIVLSTGEVIDEFDQNVIQTKDTSAVFFGLSKELYSIDKIKNKANHLAKYYNFKLIQQDNKSITTLNRITGMIGRPGNKMYKVYYTVEKLSSHELLANI